MADYSKGQIYKVWDNAYTKCYVGSTVQQLCKRMDKHRSDYKKYLNGSVNFLSIFNLFDEFGVENCKIEWVEDYPCSSKKELHKKEGEHQKNCDCVNKLIAGRRKKEHHNDNKEEIRTKQKEQYINNKEYYRKKANKYNNQNKDKIKVQNNKKYIQNKVFRLKKQKDYYNEHIDEIKEKKKQYRAEHREELSEKRKEYRNNNVERFKEYDKQHYDKYRDKKIEYQKEYRKNNKEKLKETITCECGGCFLKNTIRRHERSKQHQQYIQNQSNPQEQQ